MGRAVAALRVVDVAGRAGGRPGARRSLRRRDVRRLPATSLAIALGVTVSAMAVVAASRLVDALMSPGIGGFPPIP
jgi:hypothetical protein